jgi:hypothetical protein
MNPYAKFIVAALGGAITAALAIVPPHTNLWMVLTVLAASLTAAGVYAVPNQKA